MKTLISSAAIGMAAALWATQALAWTVDNANSDYSSNASHMSDPDEKTPLQYKSDGGVGSTYKFGNTRFSISGPQSGQSSQRDSLFAPAGQGSIGPQFNSRPRYLFPGQP